MLFCEERTKFVKIGDFHVCADCIQKLGTTKIGGTVDLSEPSDEGNKDVITDYDIGAEE